jgi:hypothetical protein
MAVACNSGNNDRIYFGAMMDDYLKVFAAFRARGRAPADELVGQNWYYRTQ